MEDDVRSPFLVYDSAGNQWPPGECNAWKHFVRRYNGMPQVLVREKVIREGKGWSDGSLPGRARRVSKERLLVFGGRRP